MWLLFDNRTSAGDVKYSDFVGYFERGEVEHFELDLGSGALTVRLRPEFRKEDTNRDEKIDEKDVLKYTVPDVNLFLVDVLEEIVSPQNRDDNPDNNVTYDCLLYTSRMILP